jgi:hypothetical protein
MNAHVMIHKTKASESVVRGLVGKIFGFDGEIKELRRQVHELSWDSVLACGPAMPFYSFATRHALGRLH